MKILHLNTYTKDGAALAAYRMHRNLEKIGFDSHMVVLHGKKQADITPIIQNQFVFQVDKISREIIRRVFKQKINWDYYFLQHEANSFVKTVNDVLKHIPFQPDIIVAHWISNFISIEILQNLSKTLKAPIVWYLLDMAPLTGGCHYAWECDGYKKRCGRCPALYSKKIDDLSSKYLKDKCSFIREMDLTFAAGSYWLENQSKTASVAKDKKVEKILLAVDPDIFRPASRVDARNELGLPVGKKIIFFGAYALRDTRKGIKYLFEMVRLFSKKYPSEFESCLFVGAGKPKDADVFRQLPNFFHLGHLNNDEMLAKAYQASDLFLCTSIEESGPMMINEALMTGTPVVAFNMGVAPDLVHDGKTGYKAELKNVESLMNGIRKILSLSDKETAVLCSECRNLALKLLSPMVQARSFEKLFKLILNNKKDYKNA